jgi:pyruvate-ferredoxin/flavodoxin oxidoreductase
MAGKMVTIDGNTAASHVAYAFSEVAAIYPITPSSVMGELADAWAAKGRQNMFGKVLSVIEMQSEGGAAGSVHGCLSAGALTTTYTASQGLLLMIPNMYKIAGEMLPTVFHVSARSLACQALSIFGDHSDVMSVRQTGFAMIATNSVQEVMDLATVAHLATLESRIPFLHFFDGFRTSHEVQKVEEIDYETMRSLVDMGAIENFRNRAMKPENPVIKVAAQNPDVYFQGRETTNRHYADCLAVVQNCMDRLAATVGRSYHLVDYVGAPDADRVLVAMGSGCEAIEETVASLNRTRGTKLGLLKVRLYRPFPTDAFLAALPASVRKIAVLDRTKEPGAIGEPLFQDVVTALRGKRDDVLVIGGRYGLAGKEFTPPMVKAVFDHLEGQAFHGFTVGITDDVTHLSLPVGEDLDCEPAGVVRCMFWGLGSDGTVGANKDSIKIIGDNTDMFAQGYFVYDSKKSYGITVSHLRFGKEPIRAPYLIGKADFVACHNPAYIGRYDMLGCIKEGGVFLLNSEYPSSEVFNHLTREMQEIIIRRRIRFYNIDALSISENAGLGKRINTVMQTAFFIISGVLPREQAIDLIKGAIKKTFGRKGEDIVKMNWACVDSTADALQEVQVPATIVESFVPPVLIKDSAPAFAKDIIKPSMHLLGVGIPVSKMSFDGTLPSATSCLEKRGIAPRVPHWLSENCIQCNMCAFSCPHAVIRAKQIDPKDLAQAPASFKTVPSSAKNDRGLQYKIQMYVEDCTGCGVCVQTCPGKKGNKALIFKTLETERAAGEHQNAEFFDALPDNVVDGAAPTTVKGSQFLKPLFEFSGACAGCGETPYVRLASQLFGQRMVIANATGCSSIYGGTFPTIPYCKAKDGRGPTWGNSLFEDNAEYGLGMRLAIDSNREQLAILVRKALEGATTPELKAALGKALELWERTDDAAFAAQKAVQAVLPAAIAAAPADLRPTLEMIRSLSDYFVDKSVWAIGGDGWAYDIGFGGLDHVLATGRNVNILVLDTEVYSNTGGQASKSTPVGAVAQFAAAGKRRGKKNLGMMAMSYGYVYVASIAMGANRLQTLKAFQEAEAYKGASIILAYAPCIAHGIDMMQTQEEEKLAVEAGYYPLYRYNPDLAGKEGQKAFSWDSKEVSFDFQQFLARERRYTSLKNTAPDEAEALFKQAEVDAKRRLEFYRKFGEIA